MPFSSTRLSGNAAKQPLCAVGAEARERSVRPGLPCPMAIHKNGHLISHLENAFHQFLGKSRRFLYSVFGNGYVTRQLDRRQGECKRCGACCKLLLNCPFLDDSKSLCNCRIYEHTSPNCTIFPLDERDLADRNRILPNEPCGYYFEHSRNGGNGRLHKGGNNGRAGNNGRH